MQVLMAPASEQGHAEDGFCLPYRAGVHARAGPSAAAQHAAGPERAPKRPSSGGSDKDPPRKAKSGVYLSVFSDCTPLMPFDASFEC